MKQKKACITLDLEPDHAGKLAETYDGWNMEYVQKLFACLHKYRVPLSVFVVAKSLKKNPDIVSYMQHQNVEFFLHSYSHNNIYPDSDREIQKGTEEFKKFFHSHPLGYRAPEGRITKSGYAILHKHGFLFDSSVFPSFWPHPKYLFWRQTIHEGPSHVMEIPITTITPLRIIFSLSWVKLLGWKLYSFLLRLFPFPDVVLFDFHLHDLHHLPVTKSLSPFWKYIYRKKQENGLQLLHQILNYLQKQGYTFVPIRSLLPKKTV